LGADDESCAHNRAGARRGHGRRAPLAQAFRPTCPLLRCFVFRLIPQPALKSKRAKSDPIEIATSRELRKFTLMTRNVGGSVEN